MGSGVGTAAVQLAHAMGCTVFGTSRTAAKLEQARALGLDVAIESSRDNFAEVVDRETSGAGVQVILDLLGAGAMAGNLRALAVRGRLVLVGLLGGREAALDLGLMLTKRLTVVGTTLRARPLEEKIAATRLFASQVVPWLERRSRPAGRRFGLSLRGRPGGPCPDGVEPGVRQGHSAALRSTLVGRSLAWIRRPLRPARCRDGTPLPGATWPSWISRTRSSGVMKRRSWVTTTSVV